MKGGCGLRQRAQRQEEEKFEVLLRLFITHMVCVCVCVCVCARLCVSVCAWQQRVILVSCTIAGDVCVEDVGCGDHCLCG